MKLRNSIKVAKRSSFLERGRVLSGKYTCLARTDLQDADVRRFYKRSTALELQIKLPGGINLLYHTPKRARVQLAIVNATNSIMRPFQEFKQAHFVFIDDDETRVFTLFAVMRVNDANLLGYTDKMCKLHESFMQNLAHQLSQQGIKAKWEFGELYLDAVDSMLVERMMKKLRAG